MEGTVIPYLNFMHRRQIFGYGHGIWDVGHRIFDFWIGLKKPNKHPKVKKKHHYPAGYGSVVILDMGYWIWYSPPVNGASIFLIPTLFISAGFVAQVNNNRSASVTRNIRGPR